jgi:hypothetical protein
MNLACAGVGELGRQVGKAPGRVPLDVKGVRQRDQECQHAEMPPVVEQLEARVEPGQRTIDRMAVHQRR